MYYKIAGLVAKMNPMERTECFARPYMIEFSGNADIEVISNITRIQKIYPDYPIEFCEYLASGKSFYNQLINYNGLMLHASAIVKKNEAFLFSATSGTGKSTHTCLWRRVFGDDLVKILNDDKPAMRLEDDTWYAYGTPWSGKTGQNLNLRFPIKGICFLERAAENKIERIYGKECVYRILDQSSKVKETELKEKQLDLVLKLIDMVPIWRMECNMEPEAAIVSWKAMSGIRQE